MKNPISTFLYGLSLILLCCGLLLPACQTSSSIKNGSSNPSGAAFQALLDSAITDKMPGILVHVESPKQKISWSGAAGVSELKTQNKLQSDQTFRIASVTKTFVACSILRLWEQSKLALTDPISKYISPEHTAIQKQTNETR